MSLPNGGGPARSPLPEVMSSSDDDLLAMDESNTSYTFSQPPPPPFRHHYHHQQRHLTTSYSAMHPGRNRPWPRQRRRSISPFQSSSSPAALPASPTPESFKDVDMLAGNLSRQHLRAAAVAAAASAGQTSETTKFDAAAFWQDGQSNGYDHASDLQVDLDIDTGDNNHSSSSNSNVHAGLLPLSVPFWSTDRASPAGVGSLPSINEDVSRPIFARADRFGRSTFAASNPPPLPLSSNALAMPQLAPAHHDVPSSGYDMRQWLENATSSGSSTVAKDHGTTPVGAGDIIEPLYPADAIDARDSADASQVALEASAKQTESMLSQLVSTSASSMSQAEAARISRLVRMANVARAAAEALRDDKDASAVLSSICTVPENLAKSVSPNNDSSSSSSSSSSTARLSIAEILAKRASNRPSSMALRPSNVPYSVRKANPMRSRLMGDGSMRCPNLVLNRPRMRRRKDHQQQSKSGVGSLIGSKLGSTTGSVATSVSESRAPSSADSAMGSTGDQMTMDLS